MMWPFDRKRREHVEPISRVESRDLIEPWEHGFKTQDVIAARCMHKILGRNIEFTFPNDPFNCDDARLVSFIRESGGDVWQCGGRPGAPIYASFEGVQTIEEANQKINEILPKLSELVRRCRR